MAKTFTGGGDPRRSMALLWGLTEERRRGPKPKFSPDAVIDAAIEIADREGIGALSMRRVAEVLGTSPMSLYTYVPSKTELVDLMFDKVVGEAPDPDDSVGGWREKLSFIAWRRFELTARHPWLLELAVHRPPLGPNTAMKLESGLRALQGLGLDELEMEMMAALISNYVTGALQTAREARELETMSGMTDAEWVELAQPLLLRHLEPERFPSILRLAELWRQQEHPQVDQRAVFAFGLERVLDGIEAYIATRRQAR